MSTLYLCDRRACEKCSPECKYTSNISHAKNFECSKEDYTEKINPLFVFKTDTMLPYDVMQRIREDLIKQAEEGVIFCDGLIDPVAIDGGLYTVTISRKETT